MTRQHSASDVRALIAHTWLTHRQATTVPCPSQLGTITLHPHQRAAADRLIHMITFDQGALLADPTGLGKTYVALAVASALAQHTLIIAPASLRPMWRDAITRTATNATIHSIEALSRGTLPDLSGFGTRASIPESRVPSPESRPLLIVDEAHHFRNRTTRRYAALTSLTTHTPVLLLTATPVHNDRHDLRTLLALFLGSHAYTADESSLARYTVRRDADRQTYTTMPSVDAPVWLTLPPDESTLHAIETLPPPVPPSDGAAADALVTHALVRQWSSSHGALRAALRRRLERAAALETALQHGRHPAYRDLRAWCLGDGAIQLAFPELLIPPSATDTAALLDAVRTHAHAVRTLIAKVDQHPDSNPDLDRANRIRAILAKHPGQPIVAFSAYEDTVHTIARLLTHDTRVCALAARAGYVAGGTISRRQAITRFAPAANSAPPPSPAHRIDLLITTDLLSEGVNLQDAVAVIHLDLPWTPARIQQRIGRVARLGSPHRQTAVYAIAPPAPSESLLNLDNRLRHKLREAGRTFGLVGSILPSHLLTPVDPPQHAATIRATLERWLSERSEAPGDRPPHPVATGAASRPPTATISSTRPGFIAACRVGTTPYLVAALDGAPPTNAPSTIAEAMAFAEGRDDDDEEMQAHQACEAARDTALVAVSAWTHHRQAHHDAGLSDTPHVAGAVRARMLRRIATTVRRAPADRRPTIAALAARARRAAAAPCTAGTERILHDLIAADTDDVTWLTTLSTFADLHARPQSLDTTEIIALLVLHPSVNFPVGCPPLGLPSCSTSMAPCSTRSSSCSTPSATPSATAKAASQQRRSGSQASALHSPHRCGSTPPTSQISPPSSRTTATTNAPITMR